MSPRILCAAIAALWINAGLLGNTESRPQGIPVRIWGIGNIPSGQTGDFTLSGTYLNPDPSVGGTQSRSETTSTTSGGALMTDLGIATNGVVRVEPGKVYQLIVGGQNLGNAEINIIPPPGYRTVLDGVPDRTRSTFNGAWLFYFQIERLGTPKPRGAGAASNAGAVAVEWYAALGNLLNGDHAGIISLVDTGTRSDWSPLFTPAALGYETDSDEILVYRIWDDLRQIVCNQAAVDIATVNSTTYDIKYYNPSQVIGSSPPFTFNGEPYVTYRVTQGGTSKTLDFTRLIRDVTPTNLSPSVSRTEVMSVALTNSWPNVQWTRPVWTLQGQSVLSEAVASSSGSGSSRSSETIGVRQPSSGNALEVQRSYTNISGLGEIVASETVGTGSQNLVTSYDYYTSTSTLGNYGYAKSTTFPGGTWEAYEYYDPSSPYSTRVGLPKYQFSPFVSSPSSVTLNATQGKVIYFEYVNDEYGAQRNPSLIETKFNNATTAKSTFNYNYAVRYANSQTVMRIERTDYTNSSTSLQTVVCVYRGDFGDSLYRGEVFMITTPDGVRKSIAHRKGTWNASTKTFTAASGNPGTGTASRVSVITGSATSVSGSTLISSYGGADIDDVYLIPNKSTMETKFRDSSGMVVRTETAVWDGSAWQTTGWTNFSYDMAGHLLSRVGSNGATSGGSYADGPTYSATYTGALKTQDIDESGVVRDYTYDASDRVATITRQGSGVIGTVVHRYTYDAAGNRTQEKITSSGTTEEITASASFDDAGRITSQTPPGLGATSHSYNVSSRTHTTTRADGATVIETHNLDGELASITGTGVVAQYRTYGVETDGRRYNQVNLGTSSSARWLKQWVDWVGRGIKKEQPGFTGQSNSVEEYFYDTGGRLSKTTKTGYAQQLFQYDTLSQLFRWGLDVDGNNTLDLASNDRINERETYLESYSSAYWLRTDDKVYARAGLSNLFTVQTTRLRLTGHASSRFTEIQQVDAEGNQNTSVYDANRSGKTATRTETRAGISNSRVTNFVNGLPRTTTSFDGLTTTTGYDGLLRANTTQDSRGNTTTTTFITGTLRQSTVTDAASAQTILTYDSAGRIASRRDPQSNYTYFAYNNRDQLTRQWGGGAYPVEYGYDSTFGQRTTMRTYRGGSGWTGSTWPTSPGEADTTEWVYDGPSGLLVAKKDALGRVVTQTYNVRGQTATRMLAREVSATYSYSSSTGELTGIDYSDSTPDVTYTYTRTGQLDSVTDATGARDFVYDPSKPWRLSTEALDSFYGSKVLTRLYETSGMVGRTDGFQLGSTAGSNSDLEHNFSYTANGRFETILSGINSNATTQTFRYAYLTNSRLISSLTIDGGHAFSVNRSYESTRDLVTSIDSKWSTTTRTKYDFAYDTRALRSTLVQSGDVFSDYGDSTHRQFQYNGRGEVLEDAGYMNGTASDTSAPMPARLYQFAYDNAGNRSQSTNTGFTGGITDYYTANAANQYVTRENNTLAVSGTANNTSNDTRIAVKGRSTAAGRQGRYWGDEVLVNNVNAPWYGSLTFFTAKPGGGGGGNDLYRSDVRTAWIAAALQRFDYDEDGNLKSDGVWDYTWDAENRLVAMQSTSVATSVGFPNRRLEFKYDFMGRRVQKRVINLSTSTEISSRRFLYDGWNLVAEFNAPGGTSLGSIVRSYTWGLDIVHSLARSGGVGALLRIYDHGSGKTFLPTYDGNGNVASLLNASTGATGATYEYSPFGEPVRAQVGDSVLADQPFRFSTKFTDVETGLVYYGKRYYNATNGRFINRDPIDESGGLNLYGFVGNNAINNWDYLGQGFFSDLWDDIKGVVKPVIGIVASAVTFGVLAPIVTPIVAGAISGVVGQFAATGDFNNWEDAALSGAIFGAVGGYYQDTWNAERVFTSAIAGGVSSELTGGDFGEGALIAGGMAGAGLLYDSLVGFPADAAPGGAAVNKGPYDYPVQYANNIGTVSMNATTNPTFFQEGGALSTVLNYVPGINATAGFHDVFQANLSGLSRTVLNIPGMPLAAGVTVAALGGTIPTVGLLAAQDSTDASGTAPTYDSTVYSGAYGTPEVTGTIDLATADPATTSDVPFTSVAPPPEPVTEFPSELFPTPETQEQQYVQDMYRMLFNLP